jgi:hypothetical protein
MSFLGKFFLQEGSNILKLTILEIHFRPRTTRIRILLKVLDLTGAGSTTLPRVPYVIITPDPESAQDPHSASDPTLNQAKLKNDFNRPHQDFTQ